MAKKIEVDVIIVIRTEFEGRTRAEKKKEKEELSTLRDWLAKQPEYNGCGGVQAGRLEFVVTPRLEEEPPIIEQIRSQGWDAELSRANQPWPRD